MSIDSGKQLGIYKIVGPLGAGGMGEVYRATDTKLDRDVAIKVLPESMAHDPERVARFEREAKVLAQLNHPMIAAIHGFDEADGKRFLVLELVEGPTLADQLAAGPLSVDESLDIARQITEALEVAHEKGIVHRDLKPANIKVTDERQVKVLDFGLAKALADDNFTGDPSDSPTITKDFTRPGMVLGTAAYMSPEQARGRPVDKRSDIWSFGVVLYECLTGDSIFRGETVTDSIGAVLHKEPDWTALPPETPPVIQLLLGKCLAKDRKRRLRDIGDACIELEHAIANPSNSFIRSSETVPQETKGGRGMSGPLVAGLVVGVAVIAVALGWFLKPTPPVPASPPVRRISMDMGVQRWLAIADGSAVQFSPAGSMYAFMAAADDGAGPTQLYLRRLDQLQATPVPAAKAVDEFCFSPDGQWIAFRDYEEGMLKKVKTVGGDAIELCEAEGAYGIDWSDKGRVVFAEATGGLFWVSEDGGTRQPQTTLKNKDVSHRWPHVLPGGESILYTARATQGGSNQKIMFQRPDGKTESVATNGSYPLYVPDGYDHPCGCVVFLRDHRLFGVRFDPNAGPKGPALPLGEGRVFDTLFGAGHFDVSADGSLIYVRNNNSFNLEWVDRAGNAETVLEGNGPDSFFAFDLSWDGQSLVYNDLEDRLSEGSDLWVYDITRKVPSKRLTFVGTSGDICIFPVWSPMGKCIVYTKIIPGQSHTLLWRYADGGEAHELHSSDNTIFPRAWSPDGTSLLLYVETQDGASDVRLLELKGDDLSGWQAGEIKKFNDTPYGEFNGSFSANGKWLAYDSNETGRRQIYVCSVPDLKNPRQVTSNKNYDAYNPIWSDGTNELLYMTLTRTSRPAQIYSVPYSVEGKSFIPEEPVPWLKGFTRRAGAMLGGYDYDPAKDRLLVRTPAGDESVSLSDRLVLVEGFADELRKLVDGETP